MSCRSVFVGADGTALGPKAWYTIRVKHGHERAVSVALSSRGFEEFLPLCRWMRRFRSTAREAERPLFPGYVFCRFEADERLPILLIPGVVHLVGIRGAPLPVDPSEMAALRAVVNSHLSAESYPLLHVGDWVLIDRGPLCGLEGRLVQLKKGWRLLVSVTLLQRSVGVEIDTSWVRVLKRAAA